MNALEWKKLALEIEATFRGDLDADREAALREHCGGLPWEAARGAVAQLVTEGQVWLPTPGELLAAARRRHGGQQVKAWLDGYETYEDWARAFTAAWAERRPMLPGPLAPEARRRLTEATG